MEGIIELHHIIFFFLIIIISLVFWMFFRILLHYSYQFNYIFNKEYFKIISENMHHRKTFKFWVSFVLYTVKKNIITQKINHNSLIEIIWVILPAVVLVFIALPSFTLLYSMDEIFNSNVVVKIIGHQWYWSYELAETTTFHINYDKPYFELINELKVPDTTIEKNYFENGQCLVKDRAIFDDNKFKTLTNIPKEELTQSSYMIQTDLLTKGFLRLLETDTMLFLPFKTQIQLLITSDDVLHSWAVPSLGVKVDAVPGRLNQINIFLKRTGVFHGQCSEICGINHGFMPIKIVSLDLFDFFCTLPHNHLVTEYAEYFKNNLLPIENNNKIITDADRVINAQVEMGLIDPNDYTPGSTNCIKIQKEYELFRLQATKPDSPRIPQLKQEIADMSGPFTTKGIY